MASKQLLKNRVGNLVAHVRQECGGESSAATVEKELCDFVNNVRRMQYGTFRRQGFFIGSGVVEAGCTTVIGARCKQSGMFWGKPGLKTSWPPNAGSMSSGKNASKRSQRPQRLLGANRVAEESCRGPKES